MIDFVKVEIASVVPRLVVMGLILVLRVALDLIPLLVELVVKMVLVLVLPDHQLIFQDHNSQLVLLLARSLWKVEVEFVEMDPRPESLIDRA
jgi:hypothetical protein